MTKPSWRSPLILMNGLVLLATVLLIAGVLIFGSLEGPSHPPLISPASSS